MRDLCSANELMKLLQGGAWLSGWTAVVDEIFYRGGQDMPFEVHYHGLPPIPEKGTDLNERK